MSNFDKFVDQEELYHTEGRRGVVNLCKIARGLGYKDPMYFGQLERNAVIGDFIEFLQDNPGVIEAIHRWVKKNEGCWSEQLEEYAEDEEQDDED